MERKIKIHMVDGGSSEEMASGFPCYGCVHRLAGMVLKLIFIMKVSKPYRISHIEIDEKRERFFAFQRINFELLGNSLPPFFP
jgi:hypothetical protein